ncbi:TraR/DksA C4-type zinc finger protein [Kosakonia radicincitans]|nr:TraR/DksA C4-type zinc finger protein [Kosakonia radicincitans]
MFLASIRSQNNETPAQTSATHCQSCSAPIPEKRQKLLPGVQTCADCQSAFEAFSNQHRRLFSPPTTR